MRIWFPNAPLLGISELDRSQLAIGVSRAVNNGTSETVLSETYLRRYLDDPLTRDPGTPVTFDVESDGDNNDYLRRYLDDPAS